MLSKGMNPLLIKQYQGNNDLVNILLINDKKIFGKNNVGQNSQSYDGFISELYNSEAYIVNLEKP